MAALTYCSCFLRGGQSVPRTTKIEAEIFQVGAMLAHFSLLGAFFSLLAASWALLAVSWLLWGSSEPHYGAQDRPRHRFYGTFGALWPFFFAFLDMVLELLPKTPAGIHSLLFVSTLQRGGTCAAHPPPPEEMPSVPDPRSKFQTSIP